jgi:hypothetical protein
LPDWHISSRRPSRPDLGLRVVALIVPPDFLEGTTQADNLEQAKTVPSARLSWNQKGKFRIVELAGKHRADRVHADA